MQSSGSTRSSSDGSKRRPCCPPQRPPPCCSGPCLLQVRSTCARSMDGRRSQRSSAASRLTLPPDSILSSRRRSRRAKFQPHSGRHHSASNSAPSRRTIIESQIQIMKPIIAPSEPYVLLKLPKFAAYQENKTDAQIQATAAIALPQLTQR